MADPRAGAEDARQWEAVDGALFIRTPEEEASGEWKPPTPAQIDANRARFTAYRAWKASVSPGQFHESGAFAAGFAAGVARVTTPAEPFTCDVCGQPAVIGLRKDPGARLRRWCRDHFPEVERDA